MIPERDMFNDVDNLPTTWTPPPGAYDSKADPGRIADFGGHPATASRGSKMELPGPGAFHSEAVVDTPTVN